MACHELYAAMEKTIPFAFEIEFEEEEPHNHPIKSDGGGKVVENDSMVIDDKPHRGFTKTSQRLHKEVPDFAQRTFECIKENPQITTAELSERTGVSVRSVLSHIALLKKLGFIRRIGGKTYGHWELLQQS